MKTITPSPLDLKAKARFRYSLPMKPHRTMLYVINASERDNIAELIATSALQGPMTIIAGSEWLPTYGLPRLLRRYTVAIKETLERIQLARAFTCYQMWDILKQTPPIRDPLLMVNLLDTFFVEDIGLGIRTRILKQCAAELSILSMSRPVVIIIRRSKGPVYDHFYKIVRAIAHETIKVDTAAGVTLPTRLF